MAGRPAKDVAQDTFCGQVAARIRLRRKRKKISAEDAAAAAGVPAPTWYRWESGGTIPLEALPAIAAALGCRPKHLVGD